MLPDFKLNSKLNTTKQFLKHGIHDFKTAISFVEGLPYAKNSDEDINLVLEEKCGTSRTKHALIVQLAHENEHSDIKLALGFYELDFAVHNSVEQYLGSLRIRSIPESASYILYNNKRIDISGLNKIINLPLQEMNSEMIILPNQIKDFINHFHRFYMINWLRENNLSGKLSVDDLWKVRGNFKSNLMDLLNYNTKKIADKFNKTTLN